MIFTFFVVTAVVRCLLVLFASQFLSGSNCFVSWTSNSKAKSTYWSILVPTSTSPLYLEPNLTVYAACSDNLTKGPRAPSSNARCNLTTINSSSGALVATWSQSSSMIMSIGKFPQATSSWKYQLVFVQSLSYNLTHDDRYLVSVGVDASGSFSEAALWNISLGYSFGESQLV